MTLGQYLREKRLEKGLSLDALAEKTRINTLYLEALEDDDLARLPHASIFIKGYVKAYSRCLALNEEDVLKRFPEPSPRLFDRQDEGSLVKIVEQVKEQNYPKTGFKRIVLALVRAVTSRFQVRDDDAASSLTARPHSSV